METIWKGRLTQAAVKYGEVAPATTVCCNACRTSVQTNLLGLAMAAVAGAGIAATRFARRLGRALLDHLAFVVAANLLVGEHGRPGQELNELELVRVTH